MDDREPPVIDRPTLHVPSTECRALERLVAWAERRHQQEHAAIIDVEAETADDDITRDPKTGDDLSMQELAVMLRCGHQ